MKAHNYLQVAHNYVKRIRNAKKKDYAQKYLISKLSETEEPERGELSYMAAQCVRMNINRLLIS